MAVIPARIRVNKKSANKRKELIMEEKNEKSEFASANLTAGQLNAIVKKLGGYEEALRFLRGETSVPEPEHLINCDADPFIPEGWRVEEHQKSGQINFNPTKTELYLSKKQKNGVISGNDLRKELKGKSVLNANVLDYLLAHPRLIPDSWKGKYVFCLGTVYRNSYGRLFVRGLCWNGAKWYWLWLWLGRSFRSILRVALASNA